MLRLRKILYATDFSSYSTQAYLHAVRLAESNGSQLIVLYVMPETDNQPNSAERAYWTEQLETVRPSNGSIPVEHVLLHGRPAEEIVRFAAEMNVDVIVMGTHGRTGRDAELMGSTAVHVMREAPCSVLVVKMPRKATPQQRPFTPVLIQA